MTYNRMNIDDYRNEFETFWKTINEGTCPHCKQSMTREQVGSCVYAVPCNHRLYQGELGDLDK